MAQKIKGIEIDGILYEFDTGLPSISEQEGGVLDESFEFASDDSSETYVRISSKGLHAKQLYVGTGSSAKTVQQLINSAVASSGGGGGAARRSVKIICFGNSFTQDSMSYVPTILKNVCPSLDVTLAIAFIGGCQLAQHYANFCDTETTAGDTTFVAKKYSLQKYTSETERWTVIGDRTYKEILDNDDWDIVTFQEGGISAHKEWEIYYEPYIYDIHKSVFDNVGKSVRLGWLSIHGTYKSSASGDLQNYLAVIENTKKVMELTGTDLLFPFGTAVQNLRTTPLNSLGEYGNLKYDSGHLQEGIGCLTAAYANAIVILRVCGYDNISIIGDTTRPDDTWRTDGLVVGAHGTTIGITEDNAYCAQIAAIQAVKNPYEIMDCNKFYNT